MKITKLLIIFLLLTPLVGAQGFSSPNEKNLSTKVDCCRELVASKPFIFIRHGGTDYNLKGLIQGRIDIPLNDIGKGESLNAAKALQSKKITKIYSSPLTRAQQTAEIIRKELHIKEPVVIVPELIERNWGELDGKPVKQSFNEFAPDYHPKGGETMGEFEDRSFKAVQKILDKNEDGVLIVAHGGTSYALRKVSDKPNIEAKNAEPLQFNPPAKDQKIWSVDVIER